MDDFVRRSDILTALHSGNIDLGFVYKETYRKLREYSREVDKVIKSVPAADVREVKRGKWIMKPHKMMGESPCCSECGAFEPMKRNFCPNCGAKMQGEANE